MSSFIDRFAIAGTAVVLGLVAALGIFGFLSLLGAEPDEPLDSLRSVEEALTPGFDSPFRTGTTGHGDSGEPAAGPDQGSPAPGESPRPTRTPAAGVLAAVQQGEGPRTPTATPTRTPAGAPPPQVTPVPTPVVTPAPTPVPETLTPAPDPCSVSGTSFVQQNGKHVRIEFGAVVSFGAGVLVVNAGGTVEVLVVDASTVVVGDMGAATLVHGEGRRLVDGTVLAELVEVLCPDWAVA